MNEFVPGYEAYSFHGISAPNGTPREIVDKLTKEVNSVLADPKLKARLAELGAEVLIGTPEDYGRYLKGEIERWAKVIEFSGGDRADQVMALCDGPGFEHAIHLKPQVVVQPGGSMLLDNEAEIFGRFTEAVPLGSAVFVKSRLAWYSESLPGAIRGTTALGDACSTAACLGGVRELPAGSKTDDQAFNSEWTRGRESRHCHRAARGPCPSGWAPPIPAPL